jgi:hypothetical protein
MEAISAALDWHEADAELLIGALDRAGFAIVPKEPTDEMIEAAIAPYRYMNTAEFDQALRDSVRGYFKAMVATASKTER